MTFPSIDNSDNVRTTYNNIYTTAEAKAKDCCGVVRFGMNGTVAKFLSVEDYCEFMAWLVDHACYDQQGDIANRQVTYKMSTAWMRSNLDKLASTNTGEPKGRA